MFTTFPTTAEIEASFDAFALSNDAAARHLAIIQIQEAANQCRATSPMQYIAFDFEMGAFLYNIILMWIAFFHLPYSKVNAHLNKKQVRNSMILSVKDLRKGRDQTHEQRAWPILKFLLMWDLGFFWLLLTVATLVWGFTSNWEMRAEDEWKVRTLAFWVKALYGLCAAPFAIFTLPCEYEVLFAFMTDAKPTAYDPNGRLREKRVLNEVLCVNLTAGTEVDPVKGIEPSPHKSADRLLSKRNSRKRTKKSIRLNDYAFMISNIEMRSMKPTELNSSGHRGLARAKGKRGPTGESHAGSCYRMPLFILSLNDIVVVLHSETCILTLQACSVFTSSHFTGTLIIHSSSHFTGVQLSSMQFRVPHHQEKEFDNWVKAFKDSVFDLDGGKADERKTKKGKACTGEPATGKPDTGQTDGTEPLASPSKSTHGIYRVNHGVATEGMAKVESAEKPAEKPAENSDEDEFDEMASRAALGGRSSSPKDEPTFRVNSEMKRNTHKPSPQGHDHGPKEPRNKVFKRGYLEVKLKQGRWCASATKKRACKHQVRSNSSIFDIAHALVSLCQTPYSPSASVSPITCTRLDGWWCMQARFKSM
jgi:hypothetical protein